MLRTLTILAASASLGLGLVSAGSAAEAAPAKKYSNCETK